MQRTEELVAAGPLRRGDHGPRVAALRTLIGRLGETVGSGEHGEVFDECLEHAVRAFQQRRGLLADGVVGPQTARVMDGARWALGDRTLLFTAGHLMRGDDVAALQERLVVLGLLAGPVDAVFGVRTDAALRELQASLGLEPDGMCGASTLRALDALARAVGGGDPWALRQEADVAGAGASLAGKVVVLDPARGPDDPGVVAHGLVEADVVLDLALRVERRLAATGVTPVLTRSATSTPTDDERARLAEQVGADVVLSLNCDGASSPLASGVATFYWGGAYIGARSSTGKLLARLAQREVLARTGLVDLGTHACTFDLLRVTRMPAVHVELGYLTNPGDAALLASDTFRDTVAEALVVAVQRLYLGDDDAATGTLYLRDVLAHAGLA